MLHAYYRTYCATYSECRRTISWAVIIWILYPLARIEVFTEIPHDQYQHDNDVPLEMLARTFNPKFFKLIEWSAEKQTKHAAMQPPQSPCTFVVYMDPSLVPFGRDFLSTHMRAFSSSTGSSGSRGSDDQPPIAYWSGQRLVLLIRHNNKPIANTLKITGADKVIAWYFANAGVARPIDSLEALQAMEKSGVTRLETTQQYLEGFTIGPDIKLEEFMSMPNMGDVDLQAPQPGIFITGAAPTAELVVDALWIPEVASQVSISEPLHTLRTKSKATAVEPEIRAGQGTKLTGNYPALLTSEAQLWLTPAVRVPLQTVLGGSSGGGSGAFTQAQLEAIVQHLDPILQSALLQKIFGFIPPDMSRVLKMFDAAHFPRVVSLIDAKSDSWGEQC